MDVESARVLVQREDVAAIGTDFVVEEEYLDPNFKDQSPIRVELTLELRDGR